MEPVLQAMFDYVVRGEKRDVDSKALEGVEARIVPESILNEGLIDATKEVGRQFECGNLYVPEMVIAARAIQAGSAIPKPQLVARGVAATGKIVLSTVRGDLHDIRRNSVAMTLEDGGYEIIDLGADVAREKLASAARENCANMVGRSAPLSRTMQKMRSVIEAVDDIGSRDRVKIIVGRAPVTESFATEIAADRYAPDASRAIALVESLSIWKQGAGNLRSKNGCGM